MENKAFGIDLGTTYSCISYVDDFTGLPQVVANMEGDNVTPSVVYFETDTNIIAGRTAKECAVLEPESSCEFVKRKMGTEKVAIAYHGVEYSPEQISSLILKKMVRDAEKALDTTIKDVVITCPAYFGIAERAATKAAAEMANLNVLEIINEPTAAALYYGCLKNVDGKVILVYDLGGGTFDVTIIKVTKEQIVAVATGGDHELGGKNWDDTIIDYFMDTFCEHKGDDIDFDLEAQQDMRLKAEAAKQQLTTKETSIQILSASGVKDRIQMTRDEFEQMTSDKLRRTMDITRQTMEAAAKKGVTQIDEIVLVGGSCKMPQVETAVKKEFPDTKILMFEPDEAVAKGAAIHADDLIHKRNTLQEWIDKYNEQNDILNFDDGGVDIIIEDLGNFIEENGGNSEEILGMIGGKPGEKTKTVEEILKKSSRLVNITSKSFGIELMDKEGHPYVKNLILKQNEVPVSVTKIVGTYEDNALSAELVVYETDEETDIFEIGCYESLGNASLELPGNLPAGSKIQVTFDLSTDGLLTVTGVDLTNGTKVKAEMKSDAILTQEQIIEQREMLNAITLIEL